MQHAGYTDILVKFRPMNPLTVAKNLKMLPLLLGRLRYTP